MGLSVETVTFDCDDPGKLADWWAERLGAEVRTVVAGEFVLVVRPHGPKLGFQRVPDPTPGKNKAHIDFGAEDVEAEVERFVSAGATEVGRHNFGDFGWVVLADPEGNVFCVAPK